METIQTSALTISKVKYLRMQLRLEGRGKMKEARIEEDAEASPCPGGFHDAGKLSVLDRVMDALEIKEEPNN